ncbi:MAG: hypothetical protein COV35_08560 [Alphaproteobacteria bacterium CG11_big_fil_rev_8_21_14_0_20_39_49]|nr:MAG: hypothetical protein COV35_08560 [Alphaproteobacteria bacterium CG11_big_fil_rev_8_21_14_0_20_39_49]
MHKNKLLLVIIIICVSLVTSCSEEKDNNPKEEASETKQLPDIDINYAYNEAVELLSIGEEMVSQRKSGSMERCMALFNKHHMRTRELREIVDAKFPQQYSPFSASLAHMINCVSCGGAEDQCQLAREFLQETNKLYKLSSK